MVLKTGADGAWFKTSAGEKGAVSAVKVENVVDIVGAGDGFAVGVIIVSWASDKMQNRKLFVWPLLLIGALAFLGSWLVGADHFWVSYTLLVIAGGAMALINSMGALGSFVGSWLVGYLNGATGSPSASYIFMGVALLASVWLTLIVKPTANQQIPVGARHA